MRSKQLLLGVSVACSLGLSAQDYSFATDQLQNLPPFFSSFMNEYMRDVNENINNSFFSSAQNSAQSLPRNSFTVGLVGGTGFLTPRNINNPSFRDYPQNGRIYFNQEQPPTIFNETEDAALIFQLEDPNTGKPLVNPNTGERIELSIPLPSGLGLGVGATPSAALAVGYGIGWGTDVNAYITPKFLSFVGASEEGIGFNNDLAWGLQLRHEISYWMPALKDRGFHISLSGGYSAYNLNVNTNLFDDPLVETLSDDHTLTITDQLNSVDYSLSTYGGKLLVGKTFGFVELTLSADYTQNSYAMVSEGGFNVLIEDNNDPANNIETDLTKMFDFDGSNSQLGYGGALTLGQGWFRTTLAYRRATIHYASIGFQFHFNRSASKTPATPKETL
jgi:hypothetical protein